MRLAAALALAAGLGLGADATGSATPERRGMTPEDTYAVRLVTELEVSPDGKSLVYTLSTADRAGDSFTDALYLTTAEGAAPRRLTAPDDEETSPRFSLDGRDLAFLSDRGDGPQIYLAPLGGGRARAVTAVAEGVEAFDWSPEGSRFVFVRLDPGERPALRKPGRKKEESEDEEAAEAEPIVISRSQIQRDGEGFLDSRRRHLWWVPAAGGPPQRLTDGPWDDSEPRFSPDGRWIVFVSNRTADPDSNDDTDLFLIRPDGSELHRLTSTGGPDDTPVWSPAGDRIAFVGATRPNDYYQTTHLMVVSAAGGEPLDLSAGLDTWVSEDGVVAATGGHSPPAWSRDGSTLYASFERHGANFLAALSSRAAGAAREIMGGPQVVDLVRFAPGTTAASDRFFFTLTDPTHPPEIHRAAADGSGLSRLSRIHDAALSQWDLSVPEKLVARNSEGEAIEAWLYPPLHLAAGARAPLILYIHGGPQAYDGDYFDPGLENQVFPAAGWAVLRVNYRGSTSYGEAFCRAPWGDWHRRELEDLMAAVDAALERPWIDPQRLGIGGWSYGGIMTLWTVGHTDRFKVGVPERFEIDYLSCFGEDQWAPQYLAELGSPFEHADLYRRLSPGTYLPAVKTPLFLIADELDGNCPPSQAMQLYQRLKLLGQKPELVIYPGEPHSMERPSHLVDRLYRLLAWYGAYLE